MIRMLLGVSLCFLFSPVWTFASSAMGPEAKAIPNITLSVLPNGTDEKAEPKLIPMAQLRGKPIVFLYWKAGDAKSETELKAVESLQDLPLYKNKVHFLTVVRGSSDDEIKAATKRARELKLKLPVVMDKSQLNSYLEAWAEFPRYGLVDKDAVLRVWHCAHLAETVGPNMTFLQSLNLAAAGKPVPTNRGTTKMESSHQLVGQKIPDVGLNDVNDKPTTAMAYVKNRPIVLAFWSVTCPHCREVIPTVAKYWLARKGNVDYVTITRAPSDTLKNMIKDLWKEKKYDWPVSYAPENSTLTFFKIVKVPTVILADSKGVIYYTWIQPDAAWINQAIEAKLSEILSK